MSNNVEGIPAAKDHAREDSLSEKAQRVLGLVRLGAMAASAALVMLFGSEVNAGEERAQMTHSIQVPGGAHDKTIGDLIKIYAAEEKDERQSRSGAQAPQEVLERNDQIYRLLQQLDHIGAREFMSQRTVAADLTKPLDAKENRTAFNCLIHNAFREAGSQGELRAGGNLMVILVTLARAMDPSMKFYGPNEDGSPRTLGDMCAIVKARNQFSWTFDKRILDQNLRTSDPDYFAKLKNDILKEIGDKKPEEALEHIMRTFNLMHRPMYYHHKDMWGEWVDEAGVQQVYGEKPVQKPGERDDHFAVRYMRYKMSARTAKMFAHIDTNARAQASRTVVGSHVYFGDMPVSMSKAARERVESRARRDDRKAIPAVQ